MIELKGIGKKFEDVTALADVSGQIHEGNVFGLVGTNGAGKSTCLRMMAGVLAPDTGEVLVDERMCTRIRRSGERYFSSRMIRITFPTPHPEI